jgi:hypothetical protein
MLHRPNPSIVDSTEKAGKQHTSGCLDAAERGDGLGPASPQRRPSGGSSDSQAPRPAPPIPAESPAPAPASDDPDRPRLHRAGRLHCHPRSRGCVAQDGILVRSRWVGR